MVGTNGKFVTDPLPVVNRMTLQPFAAEKISKSTMCDGELCRKCECVCVWGGEGSDSRV